MMCLKMACKVFAINALNQLENNSINHCSVLGNENALNLSFFLIVNTYSSLRTLKNEKHNA